MTQVPLFSIIIPCLNEEKSLPLLLKDLSRQSLQDFEVIVVDGHSEDSTVAKAKKYQKILPSLTILSSKIRNVSVQRNLGGEAGKGTYLLFNDADNRLPVHFLETLSSQLLSNHPDIFSVYMYTQNLSLLQRFSVTAINVYTKIQQKTPSPYVVEALIGFKKSIFHSLNGFKINLAVSEGTDVLKRATRKGYLFQVFSDPKYYFSLRRLKKEGLVKMAFNIVKIELLRFLGYRLSSKEAAKIYPMNGGSYYDQK